MSASQFADCRSGIPKFNSDHQRLFTLLAQIHVQSTNSNFELLGTLLATARQMLDDHCTYEENFMRHIAYPHVSCHVQQHQILKDEMDYMISMSNTAHRYISDVFITILSLHINSLDQQLLEYMGCTFQDISQI
jgi:hemerythrin-like metal-binding protein